MLTLDITRRSLGQVQTSVMCWWLAVSCERFGSGVDWYESGGYGVEKGAGVVGSVENGKVLVDDVQADKL
jgi:hypothetical protein